MTPCPICGKTMLPNVRGAVGDPAEVCPTDDAAHKAERRRIRKEARALLSATKPDTPDPEALAALAAEANPGWKDPK